MLLKNSQHPIAEIWITFCIPGSKPQRKCALLTCLPAPRATNHKRTHSPEAADSPKGPVPTMRTGLETENTGTFPQKRNRQNAFSGRKINEKYPEGGKENMPAPEFKVGNTNQSISREPFQARRVRRSLQPQRHGAPDCRHLPIHRLPSASTSGNSGCSTLLTQASG